jgi:hypothetical protein
MPQRYSTQEWVDLQEFHNIVRFSSQGDVGKDCTATTREIPSVTPRRRSPAIAPDPDRTRFRWDVVIALLIAAVLGTALWIGAIAAAVVAAIAVAHRLP